LVGNCTFELQLALGASYIALNGLYWLAALLDPRKNWDLQTRYQWRDKDIKYCHSYTLTLYETILAASRTDEHAIGEIKTSWVRTSSAAPDTAVWNKWLDEVAEKGNTTIDGVAWDPVECWKAIKIADDAERGVARNGKDTGTIKGVIRRPTDDLKGDENPACH
jgi:hypothetical protein